MARRNGKAELEGIERPTSGPVSLSNMIKLQSKRNWKGNKSWRPLEPSDLGNSDNLGDADNGGSSSPTDLFETHFASQGPQPLSRDNQAKNSPLDLPRMQTNVAVLGAGVSMDTPVETQLASPGRGSDDVSLTDSRPHVVENYLRLFGQLPDIIRLHEQTGDFDGQVVFIGHPNRDVSAHQWLSTSFQWVNIGLWSHTRRRIEGSLATDRLAKTDFSYNSIEYFKFVAENREAMIKEYGRPQDEEGATGATSSPTKKDADDIEGAPGTNFTATITTSTITSEQLEDPFVTTVKPPRPAAPVTFNFRGGDSGNAGSMDFSYEFPMKPPAMNNDHHRVYIQRERERLEILRGESPHQRGTQAHLRDVDFGEEAATSFTPPVLHIDAIRMETPLSPENIPDRLQVKSRLTELSQTGRRLSIPTEQRVAVPDFPIDSINFRNSIPAGRTVANPYRGVSTLNAAAAPYHMPSMLQPSDSSDSSATAYNFPVPTTDPALRFSDPDGLRQENVQPIANGFNQQAPTRQSFNGPFFSESMPTTHDPTASLTVQTNDEERLVHWYRDGQRVSRQQDYAKTLMAAAASNKGRDLGVIGQGSVKKHELSKYENTHFFVRVYENLFQYAEESRVGSGSKFTRRWKPAPLHLRDLGLNGNDSFYSSASGTSPMMNRAPIRPYQSFQRSSSPWGTGRALSSPFTASWRPSMVANSPYGGSVPGRI
ncbi:hypothetical protein N0V90_013074 [Kalmusia sp. IMI 367209]|nr:hypothetical protein N0V90_013074 [Kalmusia sp. IMI 367209]